MENLSCEKCKTILYGLGDDYYCPICQNVFCYECIEKHGCKVESYGIGNKFNYVREVR